MKEESLSWVHEDVYKGQWRVTAHKFVTVNGDWMWRITAALDDYLVFDDTFEAEDDAPMKLSDVASIMAQYFVSIAVEMGVACGKGP